MKNNDLTVINDGLMSVKSCQEALRSLSAIEISLTKALDPDAYYSPAGAVIYHQLRWLFASSLLIVVIYWGQLPKESAPYVILLEVVVALYFLKEGIKGINNAPKSHADALAIVMRSHTPLSKEGHDAIMSNINNNQTLNLMQIRNWLKDERAQLSEIIEEHHPELISVDGDY
ncbi:hypothetical protein ACTG16_23470 [Aeromonas sp. 23P]|uniref:hypothetical protein n=1 Tax=Aeromonas sp. 23P TaxID=3452716 RepID=UPI003F7A34B0